MRAMGLIDITRSSGTPPESETDAPTTDSDAPTTGSDERGGRRWLLVVAGVAGVALAAYLVSRRRAAREAEFTEIELEPTPSEAESESESTS